MFLNLKKINFLLLLFSILFFSHSAFALSIDNVRFGIHPEKIRTVIELNQHADYKVFVLPRDKNNPYRIVADLPSFNWNAGTVDLPKNKGILNVRTGDAAPNIMRVVIDIKNPILIKEAFILPASAGKPTRLVIDSVTVSQNEFDTSEKQIIGNLSIPTKDLNSIIAEQSNIKDKESSGFDKLKESIGIIPNKKPDFVNNNAGTMISPLRRPLIVIDAGHGGADPGAIAGNNSREKDITLSAAKILKERLLATNRYRVALTRDTDRYIKLYQRVAIARDKEADLFISLHADSIDKSNVRGASIYTLSNKASDKQTARLAARENQVDLIAGVDLSHEDKEVANILIDLAMRDTMNQSKFFANTVVNTMNEFGVQTLTRPHRYAGFAVLKAPDIPSVLVEMGFMSNNSEAKLLATNNYQEKIADSLINSLDTYFSKVRKNAL